MLSIITSYLLQTGQCALPRIGFFVIEYKPAESDMVNQQILPPAEEIVFREDTPEPTTGLIKYIAAKDDIAESEAFKRLNLFCNEWREKINAGEKLHFETLGFLQKNDLGIVNFSKEDIFPLIKPVPAAHVFRNNTEHAVLVGDKQTTSAVMNKYYSEETAVKKPSWKIEALVLFVITLGMLFYSFHNRDFSPSSVGNRNHFTINTAGETYFIL